MATTGAVLADRNTQGELVSESPGMSRAQAQRITEQIRHGIEGVWAKMYEAYEKRAHAALGYERWEDYVREEFKMSRGESYRLVNQGKVINSLAAAGGVTRARETAPYVSGRQADVLKDDIEIASVEIISAIKGGMEASEAVREAVERRKVHTNGHSPALSPPQPAPVRRAAALDPEAVMEAAEGLRERLRACMGEVKGYTTRGPRREASDPETLRDELRAWVVATSQLIASVQPSYLLRAEVFAWLKALGDSRKDIAELADIEQATVDYWTTQLKAVAKDGKRKART